MPASVIVTGADPERRDRLATALARAGLQLASEAAPGDVTIHDDEQTIVVSDGAIGARFSSSIADADLAAAVGIAVLLADLRDRLRLLADQQAIGLVASIVAHDARNLLQPMHLVAEELLTDDEPATAQAAEILSDGCRRIGGLLRRISHSLTTRPQRVDVNALVQDVAPTLQALLSERARLITRLETPLPTVWIDASELERALINLVVNARDASPEGGRIIVSTRGHADDGTPCVVVEVIDQGTGMDAETLARACEPFFTTKRAEGGSGLGLASAARAAASAGGRLELDSEPGRGTRARLWIPIK
jgi:signal transduction histidine kinase